MTDTPEEKKPDPARQPDREPAQDITPFTVLGSVFRAWFGVQTEENRQRDFKASSPVPFIVAGIIFAIAMVIGVIIMVNIALSTAGK